MRVGGFYRLPTRAELPALCGRSSRGRCDDALATVTLVAGFDVPGLRAAATSTSRCATETGLPDRGRARS